VLDRDVHLHTYLLHYLHTYTSWRDAAMGRKDVSCCCNPLCDLLSTSRHPIPYCFLRQWNKPSLETCPCRPSAAFRQKARCVPCSWVLFFPASFPPLLPFYSPFDIILFPFSPRPCLTLFFLGLGGVLGIRSAPQFQNLEPT
jgi:hypothetical protein